MNQEVEEEKGRIYARLYAKVKEEGDKIDNITALGWALHVVEELAQTNVLVRNMAITLIQIAEAVNGNEGNKQADATQVTEGSNGPSANDVGVQPTG